jgi:hypothetical protein
VVQAPLLLVKVRPLGVVSLTMTLSASDGPALVTTMVKASAWPALIDEGAPFVICRSVCATIVVGSVAELLLGSGSDDVALTVAVFVIGLTAGSALLVWIVTAIVATAPFAIVPSVQTTDVVPLQLPWLGVLETNVTPVGSVSVTDAPIAVPGPRLVTTSV